MKKLNRLLIILIITTSCNKKVYLKNSTFETTHNSDTIQYDNRNEFIVLTANINGLKKNLVFDTGADYIVASDSSQNSKEKIEIEAWGKKITYPFYQIHNFKISNSTFSDFKATDIDLSMYFKCNQIDGILGNNVINKCNWLINSNKLIFSNDPIKLSNSQLSLNFYNYNINRIYSNVTLNNLQIDSCLFDYGGDYDIQLPMSYYTGNKLNFRSNKRCTRIRSTFGANGKVIDTVLIMNCSINFSNIKIDNVDIIFNNKGYRMIGYNLLRRFDNVLINNNDNILQFGQLKVNHKAFDHFIVYGFDLVDNKFVVDSKIINENSPSSLQIGDKFIEINSTKANSFNNYCDFLEWKYKVYDSKYFRLVTDDNKNLKVKNWR